MIDEFKFESLLKDLEQTFGLMHKDEEARKKLFHTYYDHLKSSNEDLFAKAIFWLEANHSYRKFPLIADIQAAIEEVYQQEKDREVREVYCEFCEGVGVTIIDVPYGGTLYSTASPCKCAAGERWVKAWATYKKWRKKKRSLVKV